MRLLRTGQRPVSARVYGMSVSCPSLFETGQPLSVQSGVQSRCSRDIKRSVGSQDSGGIQWSADIQCSAGIQSGFLSIFTQEVVMGNNPIRSILAGLVIAALPMSSFAFVSVGISVNIAPPELPVYVQPPIPAEGYIWTPGYWAYGDDDYYWVPGTWVMAPSPGLLWTPGYWGWESDAYLWHGGYWGPHVGFYGGVNYGYGYGGVGFEGGYWRGEHFFYNRSVANIGGVHVTNVYNRTVVNNITVNRVSFNGGSGGIRARPSASERLADRDRHIEVTSQQRDHEHMAAGNRDLRASINHGRPAIAATARPAAFTGRGVVAARAAGSPGRGSESRPERTDRPSSAQHESGGARPASQEHQGSPGNAGHFAQHESGGARPASQERQGSPGNAGHFGGSASHVQPGADRPSSHAQTATHPDNTARPQSRPRPENNPRPENIQQPARSAPRPETAHGAGPGEPRAQSHAGPAAAARPPARGQPEGREHEDNRPRR